MRSPACDSYSPVSILPCNGIYIKPWSLDHGFNDQARRAHSGSRLSTLSTPETSTKILSISIVSQYRQGLGLVNLDSFPDRFRPVVFPLVQFAATSVTTDGLRSVVLPCGRVLGNTVGRLTFTATEASRQPSEQFTLWNVDAHNLVKGARPAVQRLIKHLGLAPVAREPVEHKPVLAVDGHHSFENDVDCKVIRHQQPLPHVPGGAETEGSLLRR